MYLILRYFIDRDPTYFEIVLNFMREGRVRNLGLQNIVLEEVRNEFQFYKIPFPNSLEPVSSLCGAGIDTE
jgi:BTB/POZ domain